MTVRIIAMHKIDRNEEGYVPPPDLLMKMGGLVQRMMREGTLVMTDGLAPSVQGTRLTRSGGTVRLSPGPLRAENELVAGFGILRARDLDEAVAWARRYAEALGDCTIDVRPVCEPWDIGACPRPAGLETRRYMAARKADAATESGAMPSPEAMARVGALLAEMKAAGVLVASFGFAPSSRGARARFANGSRTVTDGPFAESKELIAGFAVLEAPSVEAAVELSAEFAGFIGDVEIDFLPIVKMEIH